MADCDDSEVYLSEICNRMSRTGSRELVPL